MIVERLHWHPPNCQQERQEEICINKLVYASEIAVVTISRMYNRLTCSLCFKLRTAKGRARDRTTVSHGRRRYSQCDFLCTIEKIMQRSIIVGSKKLSGMKNRVYISPVMYWSKRKVLLTSPFSLFEIMNILHPTRMSRSATDTGPKFAWKIIDKNLRIKVLQTLCPLQQKKENAQLPQRLSQLQWIRPTRSE